MSQYGSKSEARKNIEIVETVAQLRLDCRAIPARRLLTRRLEVHLKPRAPCGLVACVKGFPGGRVWEASVKGGFKALKRGVITNSVCISLALEQYKWQNS